MFQIFGFQCRGEEEKGYKVLKSKDGKYEFSEISKKALHAGLPSVDMEDAASYSSSLSMVRTHSNSAPVFARVTKTTGPQAYRFLYRIENFEPLEFSYAGILVSREKNDRAFFSVTEYKDFIYNTGRNQDGTLECARYPKEGGGELGVVQMSYGNQLYSSRFEDSSWFSRDVFTYDFDTNSWDKTGSPQVYKVDFKTNQVLVYNAGGSFTVVGTL